MSNDPVSSEFRPESPRTTQDANARWIDSQQGGGLIGGKIRHLLSFVKSQSNSGQRTDTFRSLSNRLLVIDARIPHRDIMVAIPSINDDCRMVESCLPSMDVILKSRRYLKCCNFGNVWRQLFRQVRAEVFNRCSASCVLPCPVQVIDRASNVCNLHRRGFRCSVRDRATIVARLGLVGLDSVVNSLCCFVVAVAEVIFGSDQPSIEKLATGTLSPPKDVDCRRWSPVQIHLAGDRLDAKAGHRVTKELHSVAVEKISIVVSIVKVF